MKKKRSTNFPKTKKKHKINNNNDKQKPEKRTKSEIKESIIR